MKTLLSVPTALLLASTIHIPSAHAELQRQLAPEFSVALGLGAPPHRGSRTEERLEDRLREQLDGSGSQEWREERVREERRERGHCYRIANPTEQEGCFDDLEADPK